MGKTIRKIAQGRASRGLLLALTLIIGVALGLFLQGRVEAQTADSTTFTDLYVTDDAVIIDDLTVGGDFAGTGTMSAIGAATADPTTASRASYGGTGMAWEGTANGSEGALAYGDVSGDYTWTMAPAGSFIISGVALADPVTVSTASYGNNGFIVEGTADASETVLAVIDPTADNVFTMAAAGSFIINGATLADPVTVSTASYGNNGFTVEGTADASETSLTVVDPTADNAFVLAAAGSFIIPGATLADPVTLNTASYGGNGVTFEGTADANESSFTVTDATADNTLVWGAVGTLTSSATFVATGAALADPVTVNTASYGGTSMVFEGTADGFESSFSVTAPTADNTLVWEAAGHLTSSASFISTGAGLADPVTPSTASYGGTSIVFEGTADGFETTLGVTDPTADNTITIGAAGELTSNGAGSLGWTWVDTADNAACTASCTSAAVIGWDTGTSAIVDATNAIADLCLCAGAS